MKSLYSKNDEFEKIKGIGCIGKGRKQRQEWMKNVYISQKVNLKPEKKKQIGAKYSRKKTRQNEANLNI